MKRQPIWTFLIAAVVFAIGFFFGRQSLLVPQHEQTTSYNDVLASVQAGQVRDVTIDGTTLIGNYANGGQFHSTIPANDPQMFNTLHDHGVNITVKDENSNFWLSTFISILPFALLALVPGALVVGLGVIVFLILRHRAPKPVGQQ